MPQQNNWMQAGLLWLLSLLLMGVLVTCTPRLDQNAEIRIGLITPLTGDNANPVGKVSIEATKLLISKINRAGGLEVGQGRQKIVLVIRDDQDNPDEAVSVAQRLINQENVVALIGPYLSLTAIPVAQVAESAHIPMISPTSTNSKTTAGKKYVFRTVFVDDFQGQVVARFALEDLGIKQAAVLYDEANEYNQSIAKIFKQVFEQSGGKVVAFETYTTDANQDFRQQLQRIRNSRTQALILPNYFKEVNLQAKQARALKIKATFLGSDTWEGLELTNRPELEGAFFSTNYASDVTNQQNRAFVKEYRQAYDREPTNVAALTYDALGLLLQAIQSQGQADPESIRNGLAEIKRYLGVSGTAEFNGSGDPIKSAAIKQIKGGKAVFHKTVEP